MANRPIISIRTFDPMSRDDHGMVEVVRGGETFDDVTITEYFIQDYDHYMVTWNRIDDAAHDMNWAHYSSQGTTIYTRQATR